MSNIFATITLKNSNIYTRNCIKSFFKFTKLESNDDFFLINNDGCNLDYLNGFSKVKVINNKLPLNFAQNINQIILKAETCGKNVIIFNNDLIFTKDWFEPLKSNDDSISIPSSNQLFKYDYFGKLKLRATMSLNEFNEKYEELDQIVVLHKKKFKKNYKFQGLLMPFYCFKLPHKIFKVVGKFDETFVNGGEDIDYRIRSALKNYEVDFLADTYLLHFHGKSTWDSKENIKETEKRDELYIKGFNEKWGKELTQIFIIRKNFSEILQKKDLYLSFKAGNFSEIIRKIYNKKF